MKEINIGATIITQRHALGITQDVLAADMGVSKASVSKWETGQSYPDITLLPQLAAYFDITLDELLAYAPQLTTVEIKIIYQQLAQEFTQQNFDTSYQHCQSLIKRYYACFPFLMRMVTLLINHCSLAPTPEIQQTVLQQAITLCIRVRTKSEDVQLIKEALTTQAFCQLSLNHPAEVLRLLSDRVQPLVSDETLIAQAQQQLGDLKAAEKTFQISSYQYLQALTSVLLNYLQFSATNPQRSEMILQRLLGLIDVFDIEHLNPNLAIQAYLQQAAIASANSSQREVALAALQQAVTLFTHNLFPTPIHGDTFFDQLADWLDELTSGIALVRTEQTIQDTLREFILNYPAFAPLADEPAYQKIVQQLDSFNNGDDQHENRH